MPVLTGAARESAHKALYDLLSIRHMTAEERVTHDIAAVLIARTDPTLLVERLGSAYGARLNERERHRPARPGTSGTWVMTALYHGFHGVLELALAEDGAAANPDDDWVFVNGGLLLSLDVQFARLMNGGLNEATVPQLLNLQRLLEAGVRHGVRVQEPPKAANMPTAAWRLADSPSVQLKDSPRAMAIVAGLPSLLRNCGMSLDSPCGRTETPPVVQAVRKRNRPVMEALILAGADTSDEALVRGAMSENIPAVRSLLDEADAAFGDGARSWVLDAAMRRQLAIAGAAQAAAPSAPARRRQRVL